jgi:hypothetical protein
LAGGAAGPGWGALAAGRDAADSWYQRTKQELWNCIATSAPLAASTHSAVTSFS